MNAIPPVPAPADVILTRAVQTCYACPSQWDAWDDQDRCYYLRYRSGYGYISLVSDPDWYKDDSYPEPIRIAEFSYGHPLDGVIGLDTFAALAGIRLAPSVMRTGYGQHIMDELIRQGLSPDEAEAISAPWRALDGMN